MKAQGVSEIQNQLGGKKLSKERMREENVSPGPKEIHLNKTKDLMVDFWNTT